MFGTTESSNVGVASNIIIREYVLQYSLSTRVLKR